MEIEKVQNDTICNLQLIIEEIRNIHLAEKTSHHFNTKEIFDNHFVELFLSSIKESINHKKYRYIYTFNIRNNPPLDVRM